MKKPTFNISTQGSLPTKLSTFHVKLECTGEVAAEVKISLNLNVSAVSHRHNDTYLTFRRNKFCLKKVDQQLGKPQRPLTCTRKRKVPVIWIIVNIHLRTALNKVRTPFRLWRKTLWKSKLYNTLVGNNDVRTIFSNTISHPTLRKVLGPKICPKFLVSWANSRLSNT